MTLCPKCGAMLHVTTTGEICQNCGWSSLHKVITVSSGTVLPTESKEVKMMRTDINDLTTRVSALETELERFNFNNESLKKRCADLATDISLINHEMSNLKKLLNARCENLLDQIHDEKDKVRYIYIIRERTREFTASSDWDIVGNVCYLTFKDANEKMKQLIKDYRQSDPDYNANNLNIIQVKVKE